MQAPIFVTAPSPPLLRKREREQTEFAATAVPSSKQTEVTNDGPAEKIGDEIKGQFETQGARSRHPRGDPQCAPCHRQRDGGGPAAHVLQYDDLRGARLLHGA